MKNLLFMICLLWTSSIFSQTESTDVLQKLSIDNTQKVTDSKVFRNHEGTYVKLKWFEDVEKENYTIVLKDETGRTRTLQSQSTELTIKHLDVPKVYYWKVQELENSSENWSTFSTAFSTEPHVSQELANLLTQWKGSTEAYPDLESFLVKNGRLIDQEELTTFIYNFYKGVPPSTTLTGARSTNDCRCILVASDDYVLGGQQYNNHNSQIQDIGACNKWWRESSYEKFQGAAKELSLGLRGRLREPYQKEYTINNTSATTTRVQYLCEGENCCDANIELGMRYESEVLADGFFDSKGAYLSMAADMAFFTETKTNGDIATLGDPHNIAIEKSESVTNNPELWGEILDLITPTAEIVLGVLDLDSIDAGGLAGLTDELDSLIQEITELIGTDPLIHVSNSTGTSEFKATSYAGLRTFEPNEIRYYSIASASLLQFDEAWGKKAQCGKGEIQTFAEVTSGFAMVFSLTNEINNFEPHCCIDDKAKWVTGTYLGNGSQENLKAFCGEIMACQGLLDGMPWVHEDGFILSCIADNPDVVTPYGTATVENDCCDAPPLNVEFTVQFNCDDDGFNGINGSSRGATSNDNGFESFNDEPDHECTRCERGIFVIHIPCTDGNGHAVQIIRSTPASDVVVFNQNYVSNCPLSIPIVMEECATYTVSHTTYNECGLASSTKEVITTCCGTIGLPGQGFQDEDTPQFFQDQGINISEGITVYPNPANDNVQIRITQPNQLNDSLLEVFSVDGKKVLTQTIGTGTHQSTLDVSTLKDGIYFVRISTENQTTISKKLIIQK